VSIATLEVSQPYKILQAERTTTQFGSTVVPMLVDTLQEGATSRVYLPRRYSVLFTGSDVDDINQGRVNLYLTHEAKCPRTKAHNLSLARVI
jgi:hypothetical protein